MSSRSRGHGRSDEGRAGPRRHLEPIPLSELLSDAPRPRSAAEGPQASSSSGGPGQAPCDPAASLAESLKRLDSVVHDFLGSLGQVPLRTPMVGAGSEHTARFMRILESAPSTGGPLLGPPVFCGTSPAVGLESVFSFLGTLRKTGILRVRTSETTFMISVVNGDVVHGVSHPRPEGELLGNILVARGAIDAYALSRFLEKWGSSAPRLGEALNREELVTTADLREAMEIQMQLLFDRLLGARTSEWCFHEGEVTLSYIRLRMNATSVLLQSARLRDESRR